jgi:hypothetical protein
MEKHMLVNLLLGIIGLALIALIPLGCIMTRTAKKNLPGAAG